MGIQTSPSRLIRRCWMGFYAACLLVGCATELEPDLSLKTLKAKQAHYELFKKCQAARSEQRMTFGTTIYVRHNGSLVRCRS